MAIRDFLTCERNRRAAELRQLQDDQVVIARRIEIATAELAVVDSVIAHLEEGALPSRPGDHLPSRSGADRKRKPRVGSRWRPVIMAAIRRYPDPVKFDEVPEIQRAAAQEPADTNNIRSHVWTNSSGTGFYEKMGDGAFRATQIAADAFGMILGSAANGAEPYTDTTAGDPTLSPPTETATDSQSVAVSGLSSAERA